MDIDTSIRNMAETGKIREKLLFCTKIIVPLCFAIEIIIFLYYRKIGYFHSSIIYVIRRIIVPTTINSIILIVFSAINSSIMRESRKNRASAYCFIALISSVSINHAYYMGLWIAPIMALYSTIPFGDSKLEKRLFAISILNIFASGFYLLWEYPHNLSVYMQNIVIAVVLDSVMYLVMRSLVSYNSNMVRKVSLLMKKEIETERKLHYDFLTGVHSREFIFREFQECMLSCCEEAPAGIAIVDIDDFKVVNDTYGHDNGDIVLKAIGNILRRHESSRIHVGRFGGEEFIIVAKGLGRFEFQEELEHIREEIALQYFPFADKSITISGGMSYSNHYIPCSVILKEADEKLYLSKRNGKNRFTF